MISILSIDNKHGDALIGIALDDFNDRKIPTVKF